MDDLSGYALRFEDCSGMTISDAIFTNKQGEQVPFLKLDAYATREAAEEAALERDDVLVVPVDGVYVLRPMTDAERDAA